MTTIDEMRLTEHARDRLWLLLVVLRWITCDHARAYWANGVDGYRCPTCCRTGYSGSPFYDSGFKSP